MGQKKKRAHPDVEELLARPWCYYCERDFDDLKILISHQKAKHFKCDRCGKRLNTAGGLSVHMNQVHKEQLLQIENALTNRVGLEVEIFGMEGIPDDVNQAHKQRIIAQFYQAEAERRTASGNHGVGGNPGGQVKKPKFESPAELKKRLAEHKARKMEQAINGTGSGGNTPMDGMVNSPMQSPGTFAGSPYAPPPTPYSTAAPPSTYGSFSQEPYPSPATTYPQSFSGQPSFSGSTSGQYTPQFSPAQQYPAHHNMAPGYQAPPLNFQTPQYGSGSPPSSFSTYQSLPSHTPPGGLPNRPPSLPPAPGLPPRPSFGAPQVASHQLQQIHQGSISSWNGSGWNGQDQKSAMSSAYPPQSLGFNGGYPTNASADDNAHEPGDDIDKLIRMAEAGIKPPKKDDTNTTLTSANATATNATDAQATTVPALAPLSEQVENTTATKKKKKDNPTKMIYSDNEVSPEEKMAIMPRYAIIPDTKNVTIAVEAASTPVDMAVGA